MIIVESETKIVISQKMLYEIGKHGKCPAKAEMEIKIFKYVSKLLSTSKIIGCYFQIPHKCVIHLLSMLVLIHQGM